MDLLSVISIFPLMTVLSGVDNFTSGNRLLLINDLIKELKVDATPFFLLSVSFLVILATNLTKLWIIKFQLAFCAQTNRKLNWQLVVKYLDMPYRWHLRRAASDIGKNLLTEIDQVVYGGIMPLSTLFASIISATVLMTFLALVEINVALLVMAFFLVGYGFAILLTRKPLNRISQARFVANERRFQVLNETFAGVKEVKLSQNKGWFLDQYSPALLSYVTNQARVGLIKQIPRYMLEVVAVGVMMMVIFYFVMQGMSFAEVVPVVAVYAFTGYKLLPYFHSMYAANTSIQFSRAGIEAIHKDVNLEREHVSSLDLGDGKEEGAALEFNEAIVLEHVDFQHEAATQVTLKNINLTLRKGMSCGVVGATGSGKSTLIDCVVGLLEATSGKVKVDGVALSNRNQQAWQEKIGYVSQRVFVFDDTLTQNVVFGVPEHDIDYELLSRVIQLVKLDTLAQNLMNDGSEATIGDRGGRLSGGQIQRIGIARALYRTPDLLVLDEATSALDAVTEVELLAGISSFFPSLTVLVVTHNTELVKECDEVIILDSGKIVARGTYDHLLRDSTAFRMLARQRKDR